jgi:UDP-N-acetylglucosamine 2-epimerase
MKMLPQTTLKQNEAGMMIPHESIDDVHVHSWTQQQIFLPVSESRRFTREDAAKAFNERMLPADKRVAHPELIEYEKSKRAGTNSQAAFEEYTKVVKDKQDAAAARDAERRQREEAKTKTVTTGRFEFRFKQVRVDDVGRTGRAREGTGWRYGAPFTDRKRGTVKIPTSVE